MKDFFILLGLIVYGARIIFEVYDFFITIRKRNGKLSQKINEG